MKLSAKSFLARAHRFVVRPPPGWSDVTLGEVQAVLQSPCMGYKFKPAFLSHPSGLNPGYIEILNCDFRQGLELSTRLTTAHDVQWVVEDTACSEHKDVKRALYKFPFEIFFDPKQYLAGTVDANIRSHATGSFADSSKMLKEFFLEGLNNYCAPHGVGTRRARREQVVESDGSVQTTRMLSGPEAHMFNVALRNNRLTVLANMCGEPLFKRGFKKAVMSWAAPLQENHAAAAFLWASQAVSTAAQPPQTVHVPFAGTGTLGLEAISAILGVTPGSHPDRQFSCGSFNLCPQNTWSFLLSKRQQNANITLSSSSDGGIDLTLAAADKGPGASAVHTRVVFSDIDAEAIAATRSNTLSFVESLSRTPAAGNSSSGVGNKVSFSFRNENFFSASDLHSQLAGGLKGGNPHHHCILLNPPFGRRLDAGGYSPVDMYRRLSVAVQGMRYDATGSKLRKDVLISGYCLCPDEATWKAFSSTKFATLFNSKTRHFTHGGSDVRIIAFFCK